MVFFFTASDPKYLIYMGRDKFENELLIKYGWKKDVWFHVDDLSSAHVYLRLPKGVKLDTIPEAILEECAQLVKANSIKGNKQKNVRIVYTKWANLKKKKSMEVGQIGFHDKKDLRYTRVEERKNAIINDLNRTKEEKESEVIKQMWDEYQAKLRRKEKLKKKKEATERRKEIEKAKAEAELREYKSFDVESDGKLNTDMNMTAEEFEDDFM
mmetsp:Transcript_15627/g.21916  ORF Transcript_15627/g.21916 Transcript_15627/m.21916 type:complete len:212 (-) Transcript_15627:152-787(-)|eukprot:CAMPEP_0185262110 /NCGR_PEP_ID=MMETSP1359-20130426/10342_1 /TAXON_ID=552665 /ORGANISM="Bigelowiella longifila, Strain CCMP242" /LENGTH=211 /DNA_ID=CAMNT_0027848945 /DNA_START=151 /DNA_END=786 /DNA_ORIENTATION=-